MTDISVWSKCDCNSFYVSSLFPVLSFRFKVIWTLGIDFVGHSWIEIKKVFFFFSPPRFRFSFPHFRFWQLRSYFFFFSILYSFPKCSRLQILMLIFFIIIFSAFLFVKFFFFSYFLLLLVLIHFIRKRNLFHTWNFSFNQYIRREF